MLSILTYEIENSCLFLHKKFDMIFKANFTLLRYHNAVSNYLSQYRIVRIEKCLFLKYATKIYDGIYDEFIEN